MNFKKTITSIALTILISQNSQAGWMDFINDVLQDSPSTNTSDLSSSTLSNTEVVSGLKDALANGVESAINSLGKQGGFSNNALVKIAMPDSLNTIAATARTLGQGNYVDSFETTMNEAAEKAVPEAAIILADAIRKMNITDAMNILKGPDDAATRYFRKVSEASLAERFKPIVSQATSKAGATAAYKNLASQASPLLTGFLQGSGVELDLDQYVTQKSLDGLFKYIAIEEKRIRNNPTARTTDILKKVFGNSF